MKDNILKTIKDTIVNFNEPYSTMLSAYGIPYIKDETSNLNNKEKKKKIKIPFWRNFKKYR